MTEDNKKGISWVMLLGLVAFGGIILLAGYSWSDHNEELVGPVWVATSLNGEEILPATTITAEFNSDNKVGGSSGCNSYTTEYSVDGDEISFDEKIASTMKFCAEPVNEQEKMYLEALTNAMYFKIKDEVLTLKDSDKNVLATFEAQDQSLEGSSWDVISYNNQKGGVVSVIIDTEITADFKDEGQLTGNSGCNDYTATYESDDENITIGLPAVTFKYCGEPEGIMEQEHNYLTALQTASTYKIEGDSMTLYTQDGSTAVKFRRAED